MALLQAWFALLMLVLLAELGLGVLVLRKGGGRAASRWLGAYVVVHSVTFAAALSEPFAWAYGLATPPAKPEEVSGFVFQATFVLMLFLAPLILAFAQTFPASTAPSRSRSLWIALPFAAALLVVVANAAQRGAWQLEFSSTPAADTQDSWATSALVLLAFVSLLVGFVIASIVFWSRSRHASTGLEMRRLRYMAWAVAAPVALSALLVVGPLALDVVLFLLADAALPGGVLEALSGAGFLLLVLVPPLGMGYGLLRHRIVDLDLRAHLTIRQGLVGSVIVAAFFAVSEAVKQYVTGQTHFLVGALALVPFFLAIQPLQRLAGHVADRAVPTARPAEKYREFRRWEVYRATYEDFSRDDQVSARERRALEALARHLGLDAPVVRTIEAEVESERSAGRQRTPARRPRDPHASRSAPAARLAPNPSGSARRRP